jgi:hypothetical protein
MTVSSKFNYKDKVFWLENNKVRKAVVKSIQFGVFNRIDGRDHLSEPMYFVSNTVKSSVTNWNGGGLRESQVFGSKLELLKSL